MHKSTHKRHERQAAALLWTLRKPGSGSMGRSDETTSDSKHERIYLEAKTRKTSQLLTWYNTYRPKADKEKKVLILVTRQTGDARQLVTFDAKDAAAVSMEFLAKAYVEQPEDERPAFMDRFHSIVKKYQEIDQDDF